MLSKHLQEAHCPNNRHYAHSSAVQATQSALKVHQSGRQPSLLCPYTSMQFLDVCPVSNAH